MTRSKLCDICGHAIPRGTDHGFGRVMVGDCSNCYVCQEESDARAAAERVEREERIYEREERRSRDLDDGILYADDL